MGVFISFEGIDGCGKTTQIELLSRFLEMQGIKTCVTKEPGSTEAGRVIRKMLLDESLRLDKYSQLFLFVADRVQDLNEVIRPALKSGKWVLCDRFVESTVAYQGYGLGIELDYIDYIHRKIVGNTWPDLTLVLDCPVEMAKSRVEIRGKKPFVRDRSSADRYESSTVEFKQMLRKGYQEIVSKNPDRIVSIDASYGIDEVHRAIVEALKRKRLWPLEI